MQGAEPLPVRPRAARPDAEDDALLDAARGAGLSAARPPLAVAFGERAGPAASRGAANVHGAAARHLPAVRRVHRRLPVRGQEHPRLHVPQRGAARPARAIRCCCEARARARDGGGWTLRYRQHLAASDGHPDTCSTPPPHPSARSRAGRSCSRRGTFGSTRPAAAQPRRAAARSARGSGRGFSSNGDLLFFLRGADRYLDPSTGPTITASARVPDARVAQRARLLPPGRRRAGRTEWLWQALEAPGDLWLRALRRRLGRPRRSATARGSRRRCCRCSAWAATSPAGA